MKSTTGTSRWPDTCIAEGGFVSALPKEDPHRHRRAQIRIGIAEGGFVSASPRADLHGTTKGVAISASPRELRYRQLLQA